MKVTFCYTLGKDWECIKPLYELMKRSYYEVEEKFIGTNRFNEVDSDFVVVAYSLPAELLRRDGYKGKIISLEHGVAPVKGYMYAKHYCLYDLYLSPSEVLTDRLLQMYPELSGRIETVGFPKADELHSLYVDRESLCKDLGLNPKKPIVLYAPTWGGTRSDTLGIHNARYLKGIPNLLIVPHEADYSFAKDYGAVVPPVKGNANKYLILADILISDISSIIYEFALLKKPVVHFIPGGLQGIGEMPDVHKAHVRIEDGISYVPYTRTPFNVGSVIDADELKKEVKLLISQCQSHSGYEPEGRWLKTLTEIIYKPDGCATLRALNEIVSRFPEIKPNSKMRLNMDSIELYDVNKNVLNGVYRCFLKRDVDPSGFETYQRVLNKHGLGPGLSRVISAIQSSEEFARKNHNK